MWGCFQNLMHAEEFLDVFPTRVGVFLSADVEDGETVGLPHACGGVS